MSWFCQVGHTTHVLPVVNGICQYHILSDMLEIQRSLKAQSNEEAERPTKTNCKHLLINQSHTPSLTSTFPPSHVLLLLHYINIVGMYFRNIINLSMQAKYGLPEVENGRSEIWPSAQCLRHESIHTADHFPEDCTFAALGFFLCSFKQSKEVGNFGWC